MSGGRWSSAEGFAADRRAARASRWRDLAVSRRRVHEVTAIQYVMKVGVVQVAAGGA